MSADVFRLATLAAEDALVALESTHGLPRGRAVALLAQMTTGIDATFGGVRYHPNGDEELAVRAVRLRNTRDMHAPAIEL